MKQMFRNTWSGIVWSVLLLMVVGMFYPMEAQAAYGLRNKVNRNHYHPRRMRIRNPYIAKYDWDYTTSLTLDALYYYGDVENRGFAVFNGPLFLDNLSGLGKFNFTHRVGRYTHLRYTLAGGFINGSNEKYADQAAGTDKPLSYRSFHSWVVNGSFGVEVYPVQHIGLYLYAGVLFNYSRIEYSHWKTLHGEMDAYLPMVPFEIGYAFRMSDNWFINVHLGWTQGLCDKDGWSLDAFPHMHVDKDGTERTIGLAPSSYVNKMADGWFSLGITISYTWQNKCITCQFH